MAVQFSNHLSTSSIHHSHCYSFIPESIDHTSQPNNSQISETFLHEKILLAERRVYYVSPYFMRLYGIYVTPREASSRLDDLADLL
jgi:hypothetical protein